MLLFALPLLLHCLIVAALFYQGQNQDRNRSTNNVGFQEFDPRFNQITGDHPRIELALENNAYPFAHEACVYFPSSKELFITSSLLPDPQSGAIRVQISKITTQTEEGDGSSPRFVQEEINPDIPMANGGTKYRDGVLFCSQGTMDRPAGLVYMARTPPYNTTPIVDSFYTIPLNSPNDVVVDHADGSIWFTDPPYGHDQGFQPPPQLPGQVYRFEPQTRSIRMMADGLGRPNGIAFAPDGRVVYVTDTGRVERDVDPTRAATIYAYDIAHYDGQPFLVNRRVHAMTDSGIPDGIKCDLQGNVYSGCADGIHVWSKGGVLLGKILIPGGVANFCFTEPGEIMALNSNKLWRILLAPLTLEV